MFPTNWAKIYNTLPGSPDVGGMASEVGGYFSQWFTYAPSINPLTFSTAQLAQDSGAWVFSLLSNICGSASNFGTQNSASVYVNVGGTILSSVYQGIFLPWSIKPCLPMFASIILQTFTGVPGPSGRGRHFVGQVPLESVVGNVLTSTALANCQIAAQQLLVPLISQGITFTPGLASYRDVAFYQYTVVRAVPLLGTIRRRKRFFVQPVTPIYPVPPA